MKITSEQKDTLSQMKVLVVDDIPANIDFLGQLLQRYFKDLKVATNGKQALKIFENSHADVLLTDVTMPEMNGIKLAKKVKALNKDTLIVFITGHNEESYIDQFKELGGHYFVKPVEKNSLLELIADNVYNRI